MAVQLDHDYIVLPITHETQEYINTFLQIGCHYQDIIQVIPEFLRYYSYVNIQFMNYDINEIRREIFETTLINAHVKLTDLNKPVYYALFNYYLDRLLSVWVAICYAPEGIETLLYDLSGDIVHDDMGAPMVELYYSEYIFHEVKDYNVICRSIYI